MGSPFSFWFGCTSLGCSVQNLWFHRWDPVPWPGTQPGLCTGNAESEPLDHQGSPRSIFESQTEKLLFIHEKSSSMRSFFQPFSLNFCRRNDFWWAPRGGELQDEGWWWERSSPCSKVGTLGPTPKPLRRGEGLEFFTDGLWFNQSCLCKETSIKTSRWESSGIFRVGEHTRVPGG